MTVQHDWIPAADTFSERLVLVRHRMGWNLKEAALACGISPQSWREWELEHREPRRYQDACAQIALRTGCNRVWLMTGANPGRGPSGHPAEPPTAIERPPFQDKHPLRDRKANLRSVCNDWSTLRQAS